MRTTFLAPLLAFPGVSSLRADIFTTQGSLAGEITTAGARRQTRLTALPQ